MAPVSRAHCAARGRTDHRPDLRSSRPPRRDRVGAHRRADTRAVAAARLESRARPHPHRAQRRRAAEPADLGADRRGDPAVREPRRSRRPDRGRRRAPARRTRGRRGRAARRRFSPRRASSPRTPGRPRSAASADLPILAGSRCSAAWPRSRSTTSTWPRATGPPTGQTGSSPTCCTGSRVSSAGNPEHPEGDSDGLRQRAGSSSCARTRPLSWRSPGLAPCLLAWLLGRDDGASLAADPEGPLPGIPPY